MNLILHSKPNPVIAEAVSDAFIIKSEQDVISVLEELIPAGANRLILHQENIVPEFFDLKTGLAGAVLQKFVNYQVQVAIVGDFANIQSKSLRAFIYESNRGNQIFFLESVEAAIQKIRNSIQS